MICAKHCSLFVLPVLFTLFTSFLKAQAPVARAQNAVVYLDGSGNGSLSSGNVNDGSTAASGIANLSLNTTAFSCSDANTKPPLITSLDLDGTNDFINVPNNAAYETSQGALEMWVKPNSFSGNRCLIAMRLDGTGVRYSYFLNQQANQVVIWNGSTYDAITYDEGFTAGTWYHIALVYENNRTDVFINGHYEASLGADPTGVTGRALTIGSSSITGAEAFPGQISDVRVWNDKRTPLEIMDHKDNLLSGNEAGLVGYFPVLKGTGNTVYDHSGNSNNGTLTNMDATSDWINNGTQVILTVTDNNSNTDSDTAYVTIVDSTLHTVQVQNDTNIIAQNATVNLTTTSIDNGTSDNCTLTKQLNRTTASFADSIVPLYRALDFDGTNDYVVIPNHADFEFTTGTIELWVKPTANNGNEGIVAMRSGTTRYSFHLNADWDNLGLWNGSTFNTVGYDFQPGEWYHLAFTIVPNRVDVFVNGQGIGTFNSGINSGATGLDVIIGHSAPTAGSEAFPGQIDEVRFWNDLRTTAELQAQMYQSLAGNEANLVAYYPFNEATDTIATDESSNSHNGVLTNMDPATDRINNGVPVVLTATDAAGYSASGRVFVVLQLAGDIPFLSGAAVSISENDTAVTTVSADRSNPSYSISGGPDSAFFTIVSSSGLLYFKNAPDFENPLDSGANNVYNLKVTATAGAETGTQSLSITVTDVDEIAPVLSSSVPTDGTTGLNTNIDITLTFSENIRFGSGKIYLVDLGDDSGTDFINVSSPGTEAVITNNVLTLNPYYNVEGSAQYAILIDTTAILDIKGNFFAGILDSSTLNFSTMAVTVPTITSASLEGSPASTDSVIEFRLVFSQDVSNVTIDDFKIDYVSGFAEGMITQATSEGDTAVLIKAGIMGSEYNQGNQVVRLGIADDHNIFNSNGDALSYDNSNLPTFTSTLQRNKGNFHMILEDDDLPDGMPFRLNASSLGILIPQLPGVYPNSEPVRLEVIIDSLNINTGLWTTTTENLTNFSSLKMKIWVLTGGQYVRVLNLSGNVSMVGSVQENSKTDEFGYTMSSLSFSNLATDSSTIGTVNTFLLQFKLNLASIGLVTGFNKRWSKLRYPLPPVMINEVKYRNNGSDTIEFIEFYDGGIGNVDLPFVNVGGFPPFNLVTDASGYFVIGNSNVPNVDQVWGSPYFGNTTRYYPGDDANGGVSPDLEALIGIHPGALSDQYSIQRFPQNSADRKRGDESQFTSAIPTPGEPNTIYLVEDSLSIIENIDTLNLDAFGGDTNNIESGISYSISGGADQSLFSINASNGLLSFNAAPDYEDPLDADKDNLYEVIVTASRTTKNDADPRTFEIAVTDVLDHSVWDNGAWVNGAPNLSWDAIIDDNAALSSFSAKKVRINASHALNIDSGHTATISGNVTNNGNGFAGKGTIRFNKSGETLSLSGKAYAFEGIIDITNNTTLNTNDSLTLTASSVSSYGQLTGNGTVAGNVRAQAWLDVSTARYHYLGSPFTNATLAEFNEGQTMVAANTGNGTIWQWNASTASWEAPSALTDVAAGGKGYAIYAGTNAHGTFLRNGDGVSELDGTIASGDISVTLGYNDGQSSSVSFVGGNGQSSTEGWNLLSNPYPSQYDWNGQALPAGMNNALYVNKGGAFASYVNGIGTNGGTQYLAPFQGFWVQTSSSSPGNFTFEQDQRVTAPSTALMKTSAIDGVFLSISGGNLLKDETFIGFDALATNQFDSQLDARKLINTQAPNLAVSYSGEVYSICRVPKQGRTSFQLEISSLADAGKYSFQLNASELQSYTTVHLEDKLLNVIHNLSSSDYNFIQNESFGQDRFVLHFRNLSVGQEEYLTESEVYGYATEEGLTLELGSIHQATIRLYSASGKLLEVREGQSGQISFNAQARGIYIVNIQMGSDSKSIKILR